MKAIVDGIELNLIPFRGNPQIWWDGSDESKLFKWQDIQTVGASSLNSSYSALRLKIGVSVSGTHHVTNKND